MQQSIRKFCGNGEHPDTCIGRWLQLYRIFFRHHDDIGLNLAKIALGDRVVIRKADPFHHQSKPFQGVKKLLRLPQSSHCGHPLPPPLGRQGPGLNPLA